MARVKEARLVFVSNGDDWEGLYINGRMATQGHHVTVRDMAEALKGYHVVTYEQIEVNMEEGMASWLTLEGLPCNLNEIPQEARIS